MAKGQAKSEMPATSAGQSKYAGQSKARGSKSARESGQDAIALLTEDHKKVQALFNAFERMKEEDAPDDEKAEVVQQACQALTIHAELEEDIFYPAVRDAIDDDDLLDEAEVEHATARDLIEQLEVMEPDDELYDAKFSVLGEYVNHHIKEEQDQMFPQARSAKMDLSALGAELAERKQELMAEISQEFGEDEEDEEGEEPEYEIEIDISGDDSEDEDER